MSQVDRKDEAPQQIDPESVPVHARITALEQALQFTMGHIKVSLVQPGLLVGSGPIKTEMTLLEYYLQQLRQSQMVVGAK